MRRSKFTAVLLLSVILFGIAQPAFAIDRNEVSRAFDEASIAGDLATSDPFDPLKAVFVIVGVGGNIVKQLVVGSEAEQRAEEAKKRKEEEERKKQESSWWWPF